jgi:hypothetical protein
LDRILSHYICFVFQPGIVIDWDSALHLHGRLHSTLRLLHHMPGFVRQMLFLPRCKVDVSPLRIGMRIKLGRLG